MRPSKAIRAELEKACRVMHSSKQHEPANFEPAFDVIFDVINSSKTPIIFPGYFIALK